jgi:hypothetical protein
MSSVLPGTMSVPVILAWSVMFSFQPMLSARPSQGPWSATRGAVASVAMYDLMRVPGCPSHALLMARASVLVIVG